MKISTMLLAATALLATTPAAAAIQSTSYTFVGTDEMSGGFFSGSFALSGSAGAYTLTAFSATYAGYTHNLSNTGLLNSDDSILIGNSVGSVDTVSGGTDDFFLGYFDPSKIGAGSPLNASALVSSSRLGDGYTWVTISVGAPLAAAVPEPATWAMMMLGFGGIGYALRRRVKARPRIRFA